MLQYLNGNQDFDNSGLILFLFKWWKALLIIALIAAVASIFFSSPLFITPKYKSTVIMFPVATNSVSKVLISQTAGVKEDILGFGEEEQAEQLLQILNSNMIRDRIIEKYNLIGHYNIKQHSKFKYTRLYNEYENNIKFRRTEYMAVKVTVLDRDAQMAADIANDIAILVDSVKNAMQKERAQKAFEIVEKEYLHLEKEVQIIVDSLKVLGRMGVNDYERQSEVLNEQLALAIRSNDRVSTRVIQEKLDIISEYGGNFMSLKNALEFKTEQLTLLKAKYQEAKMDAEQDLPQKFVVNRAYKAERKSYPIRSLIIVVSVLSSILLAIIAILILENLNALDFKKKKIPRFNLGLISARKEREERPVEGSPPKITGDQTEEKGKQQEIEQKKKEKEIKETPKATIKQTENKMENYFDNRNLIQLLLKWKIHLAVIVGVAAFLAIIFSSPAFITPKFKSYAILYPANVSEYSDESETEQMLQIMQAQDIKDSIIKKFDLAKHYDLNPDYKYFRSAINYEYGQNVSINKTPYDAVTIEVLDKDPQIACDMVNAIIHYYNKKVQKLHKSKYFEVMIMYQGLLSEKRAKIDSIKQRLYQVSYENGILSYEHTSDHVMAGYLKTIMGSDKSNINQPEVLRLKENLEKYGGEVISLIELIRHEARTYTDFETEYEDVWRFYNAEMTYSNVITEPFPSDKKAYPVRWLIVMITVVVTFFLSAITVLILENYKFVFGTSGKGSRESDQ